MSGANAMDWHGRAVAAARAGDFEQAFELLRREMVRNPASRAATCDAFTIGARSGSPRTSRLASWAVRLNPLFEPGWRNLLHALDAIQPASERRATARRVALMTVGNGPDARKVGEIFMGLGDFVQAARVLRWTTVLQPGDVGVWFALAQSLFQIKDHHGAVVALAKARDAGLPREQELFWRARSLLALRRYEEADAVLDEARRGGGELAARCRILMHTARASDFRVEPNDPSR